MGQFGLCSLAVITLLGVISQAPGSSSLAVMSVDLGSEWLKIALVKPGVPMEIVLNKESRRKTPVVVALRDGDLQIGDPALSTATRYPKSAYFYLQDLLGRSLDSPVVQTFQKRFPYYELLADEERGTVLFKHDEDVNYSPEELLAVILNKSREIAQDFAEQPVKDIVITVPAYFNQAERKAIMYAAELANLKVLQLMNANTAVALNYGVFRRNDFNATPTNIMFYDMGAGSATATIVSYQVAKQKEKGVSETNPQLAIKGVGETVETVPMRRPGRERRERNPELEIRGVGFDRTLGGLEMEFRLRDHLAKLFTNQKKTPNSVYDSPRSMAKLLKEAKRVKKVLSANMDHFSQIEGLLDDKDFTSTKVTRSQLEEMNADLFERIKKPIEDALEMSEMSMREIDQVILVGGCTRVPKVQEVLLKVTGKKELGKNINADEAAAMGAVYQAAHLGKGFKVKKFVIKDANLFPIQVSFQRTKSGEDGEEESVKTVKRTLFGRGNPYPQKKVMTFNRHTGDFNFNVGYNDLEEIFTEEELKNFGSQNLTAYTLTGVADALAKNSESESKGIKAHFRMDDSGILHLDNVESVFEKTEQVMEEVNDTEGQSTFANPVWKGFEELSSTISNFFSGGGGEEGSEKEEGGEKGEGGEKEQPKTEEGATETGQGEEAPSSEDKEDAPSSEDKEDTPKTEESSEKSDEQKTEEEGTGGEEAKTDTEETKEDTPEKSEPESGEQEEPKKETKETDEDKDSTEDKSSDEDQSSDEDKKESEESDKEEKGNEETEGEQKKSDTEEPSEKKEGEEGKEEESGKKEKKKEKKKVAKPKVVTIKENITVVAEGRDIPPASKGSRKASRNKLKELKNKELAKQEREQALNNLETFIYEMQDKLYDETWEECSVEEERDSIRSSLSEASDWLYEQADDAEAKIFKDKLKELKKGVKNLKFRVSEKQERPELIAVMKESLNYSHHFLMAARNMSEEDQIFTDTEIKMLATVYNDTLEWFRTKSEEQENTPCTHEPVMLTGDMKDKYMKLDRELHYLYNKAKNQPKKKKPKKSKKKSNETETAETGAGEGEEKTDKKEEQDTEETVDKPAEEDVPPVDEAPKEDDEAPTEGTTSENNEEAPSEEKKEEEQEEVLQLGEQDKETVDEAPKEDGEAPTEGTASETQEEAPSEEKKEEEEVLQLEASDFKSPAEEETIGEENRDTDKSSDSKPTTDSQSESSQTQTDQSDDTSDHNKKPNTHNTGEL